MIYKCRRCGFILYTFERVGQDRLGIPTPSDVICMYRGRCPRCGNELKKPDLKDVKIGVSGDR